MFRTCVICLFLLSSLALAQQAHDWPNEWEWNVASPRLYSIKVDHTVSSSGTSSALISSKGSSTTGIGFLMQATEATDYRGKRVRYSGDLKTQEVKGWAGLWFRAVDAKGKNLVFGNMEAKERRLRGDNDWQRFDIVVDVPARAANVLYGVILSGSGKLWSDGLKIEVVDESIPVTSTYSEPDPIWPLAKTPPSAPRNLDFEQ